MFPPATRHLLITADDFGIGPDTSRGILELAARGAVTSTVLLVTSPYAEESVRMWNRAGRPLELGWHPCLTLDAPLLPPAEVPSLVGPDGRFPKLGGLLKRLVLGRVREAEIEAEFHAQLRRFVELVGFLPANVNAHHHIHIFRPVGDALARVLRDWRPFVRRVVEPLWTLWRVPGARLKRAFLTRFGRRSARRQAAAGLPGNEALVGVTDPEWVRDPRFFTRWLRAAPGRFVELCCHPGRLDFTLHGRDGTLSDGQLHRRLHEFEQLADAGFLTAARNAGFEPVTAAELVGQMAGETGMGSKRAG
ncbi:MAG TPA: ChbG/HpnK family deacetylase [Gemmataceae bacterium]|nr:ChbG/HpnK family deacetylase [Gemmataceae bacterium]